MIRQFTGPYRFLSNFYLAPVVFDHFEYRSVEHAYQAAKTLDPNERLAIAAMPTCGDAKRMGRRVTLRADWDAIKIDVMRDLLKQKFAAGSHLASMLLATDGLLQEGNTWGDTFWGVCNGIGENWLGQLLMERREMLRQEQDAGVMYGA